MGRARIQQLLADLKANQEAQSRTDAMIFTVAQVAVNELAERVGKLENAIDEDRRLLEGWKV